MKITAGLGSADEYIRFVEAGADEFFSGFVPYSWTEKYGTVMPLNRREVLCYHVQLGAFSELEILSEMIQKYKKPVHLTFNSLYYIPLHPYGKICFFISVRKAASVSVFSRISRAALRFRISFSIKSV